MSALSAAGPGFSSWAEICKSNPSDPHPTHQGRVEHTQINASNPRHDFTDERQWPALTGEPAQDPHPDVACEKEGAASPSDSSNEATDGQANPVCNSRPFPRMPADIVTPYERKPFCPFEGTAGFGKAASHIIKA
jgi:hypothetical protein